MSFVFKNLEIEGLVLIVPERFNDDRGFFLERYKYSDFLKGGISDHFVQDNHSRSVKGVLRGLHYQKEPRAQGKLIYCVRGRIFDVAVDIRIGSPFFGKWFGVELSEENNYMLYIPKGFAHGFLVLSDEAEVVYKCTDEYSKENDRGIIWNDPEINIAWPMIPERISEKDRNLPLLKDADINFYYKERKG